VPILVHRLGTPIKKGRDYRQRSSGEEEVFFVFGEKLSEIKEHDCEDCM
jgi:hypothetical protein